MITGQTKIKYIDYSFILKPEADKEEFITITVPEAAAMHPPSKLTVDGKIYSIAMLGSDWSIDGEILTVTTAYFRR